MPEYIGDTNIFNVFPEVHEKQASSRQVFIMEIGKLISRLADKILAPFQLLYHYRFILYHTTKIDVNTRFVGSFLGLFWLFLYPLLFLGVYAAVYVFIFKVNTPMLNSYEYVALIFCGLIPFIGFSEALGFGVSSIVANASLIKNTLFPIELVPVKAVFVSQCTMVVGMALLFIVLFALKKLLSLHRYFWLSGPFRLSLP